MQRFKQTNFWVFDLDDTLYRPECGLVQQMHVRVRQFVCEYFGISEEQADHLRRKYQSIYGTTLSGLMRNDGVAPQQFLDFVHDLDFSVLQPQAGFAQALKRLPGRKIIFTNGPLNHARRVVESSGLADIFEDIFDIQAAEYVPKPAREAYDRLIHKFGINCSSAAMFEDQIANLINAHNAGMTCVLVAGAAASPAAHVHYLAPNLPAFVSSICRVLIEKPSAS